MVIVFNFFQKIYFFEIFSNFIYIYIYILLTKSSFFAQDLGRDVALANRADTVACNLVELSVDHGDVADAEQLAVNYKFSKF